MIFGLDIDYGIIFIPSIPHSPELGHGHYTSHPRKAPFFLAISLQYTPHSNELGT
jgi:hypothetical protein